MSLVIAVACEADSDFQSARVLIDRLLCEQHPWIEEHLHSQRSFVAAVADHSWTRLQNAHEMARERGLRPRKGHFNGQPGEADALLGRSVMLLLSSLRPRPSVLIVLRDIDNHISRMAGWQQVRNEYHGKPPLITGLAIIKRENWILAGYSPDNDVERSRLRIETTNLGFDPTVSPHEADAHDESAKRSPKRILTTLISLDGEAKVLREIRCLQESDLSVLTDRGQKTGLAQFLIDLRTLLCPLLGTDSLLQEIVLDLN